MTGIGPEFLKLLRGIEWDTLTARDAVDLRAALKEAVTRSDDWYAQLSRDFAGVNAPPVPPSPPPPPPAAKVAVGRPQVEASSPREPKPGARSKRVRGRPLPKAKVQLRHRPAPAPLAVGGADAAVADGPRPAQIFENSYVSKDGPRNDVPAVLPADHPRNFQRPSSVTPEVDMSDFHEAEEAMRKGTLGKVFQ